MQVTIGSFLSNRILALKKRIPHQVAGNRRVVSTSPEES